MRQKSLKNIELLYDSLQYLKSSKWFITWLPTSFLLVGNMSEPKHQQNAVIKYTARKLIITETQIKHYFENLKPDVPNWPFLWIVLFFVYRCILKRYTWKWKEIHTVVASFSRYWRSKTPKNECKIRWRQRKTPFSNTLSGHLGNLFRKNLL